MYLRFESNVSQSVFSSVGMDYVGGSVSGNMWHHHYHYH